MPNCFLDRQCECTPLCQAYREALTQKCVFTASASSVADGVAQLVLLGSQLVRLVKNREVDMQRDRQAPEVR